MFQPNANFLHYLPIVGDIQLQSDVKQSSKHGLQNHSSKKTLQVMSLGFVQLFLYILFLPHHFQIGKFEKKRQNFVLRSKRK